MALGGAPSAGTVELDVVGDFTKFERDVKGKGSAAGSSFGTKFSEGFGGTVAKLGATYVGAQFGRDVIEQASDLQEATNVTGLAFGKARDEVDKLASSANTMFGLTEAQFRQMGAQVGNLFVGAGVAERDAAKLTNSLIQRATDMGSAWNAGTDEVTEAINSGLIGSFEPLRKYGVILDKATVTQKALEMGLVDANGEITKQGEKLATAQLIMEQTENVAGDFAATSDGVATSSKILGAQWKDMQAHLGQGLLPVLSMLMGIMRQLGPEGMKWVVIGGAIAVVFVKLVGAASAFGKALSVLAANPWVLVALAIVAVGVLIWKNWDTIVEKLGAAWDWISTRAGELAGWFSAKWEEVKQITTAVWDAITKFFVDWWPFILGVFTGGIGLVVGLIIQHWDTIVAKTGEAWDWVTGKVSEAASAIGGFIDTWVIQPAELIIDTFGKLPGAVSSAWDGIKSTTGSAVDWVKTKLGELRDAVDKALGPLDEIIGKASSFGGGLIGGAAGLLGFDTGGVVPGPRGAPRLVIAHAGETILPTHKPGGGAAAVADLAPAAAGGDTYDISLTMRVDAGVTDPRFFEAQAVEMTRVVQRELDRQRRARGAARGGITG